MKKNGRFFGGWLLVVALFCNSISVPVYATSVNATVRGDEGLVFIEGEVEYYPAETSGPMLSFFGATRTEVLFKETNEVEWIDRLDIEDGVRDFYEILEEGADNDGIDDVLIDDSYFDTTSGERYISARVISDEVTGYSSTDARAYAKYAAAAVRAAFFAFDRDHPEVFWLDGGCMTAYSYAGKPVGDGNYQYVVDVWLYLKNDSYDIRATGYQSASTIKSAISNRDADADVIISGISSGSNYDKIRYFNEVLTKTNEYNTSDDLNSILHEGRECIGALGGKTGAEGPVCEAYARAFKVLCDKVNIPCVLVDGTARNAYSSGGHMWNYVQLDGAWYGVDVTWNDPSVYGISSAESGFESEDWLLVGSQTVIDGMAFIESHPVSNIPSTNGLSYINGPVLNETGYVQPNPSTISDVVVSKAGNTQSTFFYGDIITVTAKVTAGDLVASNQTLGLYYGDTLLAESSTADSNGVYTLTYNTTDKKVPGSEKKTLTLRFAGGSAANGQMSVAEKTFSVTIEPVTPTVMLLSDDLNMTYTGQVPAIKVLVNGVTYGDNVTYEYKTADNGIYKTGLPIDVGTYTIRANVPASADGFYTKAVSAEETLRITKSAPTIAIGETYYKDKAIYGDGALRVPTEAEMTVTGAVYDMVVFTWYEKNVAEANKMTTAPIDAGTYVLTAEIAASKNNEAASAQKTIVINAKEITVAALEYTMTFGDKFSQNTNMVSVNPALAGGDAMTSIVLTPSTLDATTDGTLTPSNAVIKNGTEDKTENYAIEYNVGRLIIARKNISDATVMLDIPEEGYTFDNTEKKPAVTVTLNEKILVEGRDYSVSYKNNIKVGVNTAEVIVTGIGNYSGSVTKNFSIAEMTLEQYYSPVFNETYYYNNNSDLASAVGSDATALLNHFIDHGMREGRRGSEEFDLVAYKELNSDLVGVYGDDNRSYYIHYIDHGKAEGRKAVKESGGASSPSTPEIDANYYSAVFNATYYYNNNSDLASAIGSDETVLLNHFIDHGMREGRRGSEEFDLAAYKELNSDLVGVYGDDNKSYYIHYIEHGKAEGRKAVKESGDSSPSTPDVNVSYYSAVFNAEYYYNNHNDLATVFGLNENALLNHFIEYGMREGRRGSEEFDVTAYKELNSDLVGVYGDDNESYYIHYIEHGKAEGRKAVNEFGGTTSPETPTVPDTSVSYYSAVFNADYYYNNHSDLATAIGWNETALLKHFIEHGMAEGRRASEEFDVGAYKDLNSDLVSVYGDDNQSYYIHYIEHGKAEGRPSRY